jgi:hypothetical protein
LYISKLEFKCVFSEIYFFESNILFLCEVVNIQITLGSKNIGGIYISHGPRQSNPIKFHTYLKK